MTTEPGCADESSRTSDIDAGLRPLRILLMTDRIPGLDNGYGLRVQNVLAGLASVGDVLACVVDSSHHGIRWPLPGIDAVVVRADNVGLWRRWVQFVRGSPGNVRYLAEDELRARVTEQVGNTPFDMVWCSRARVQVLTAPLALGPRIVDFDDLNDDLTRSEVRERVRQHGRTRNLLRNVHDLIDAWHWRRLQRAIAGSVEQVVVCSTDDLERLGVANGSVVPNGYPRPDAPLERSGHRARRLLIVGPLTYEPNRLAVRWFVREILPRIHATAPDAELMVVGDTDQVDIRPLAGPGVSFTGHVPAVEPFYTDAAVAAVPLLSGGGTRMKVLEAMARGVPVVSTSFGCRGHGLVGGTDLLVADDADTFAAACLALFDDHALSERLVDRGRRRFTDDFTSDATIAAVRRAVLDVADETRPGRTDR